MASQRKKADIMEQLIQSSGHKGLAYILSK